MKRASLHGFGSALLLLGWLLSGSCTSNLESLADDGHHDASLPPDGGGEGGSGGASFPPPAGGSPPTSPPVDQDLEPQGVFALTLLHGVVDVQTLFFCWTDADGDAVGDPWPSEGLAFGQSLVRDIDHLDGRDPDEDALGLIALATSEAIASSDDCAGLLARDDAVITVGAAGGQQTRPSDAGADAGFAEPPLRAAVLPLVPAGSLDSGGSYLLALGGCLGGVDLEVKPERGVCGPSFFVDRPTLMPMLVRLSRQVAFGNPTLQFMQGSLGAGEVSALSVPNALHGGQQVTLATRVGVGVIAPYPPLTSVALQTFGSPLKSVALHVESSEGDPWTSTWGKALELGGIDEIETLRGYTLVLLGASPWLQSEYDDQWWNPTTLVFVKNSP